MKARTTTVQIKNKVIFIYYLIYFQLYFNFTICFYQFLINGGNILTEKKKKFRLPELHCACLQDVSARCPGEEGGERRDDVVFVVVYLFLAVFLLNDAAASHVDILIFVSVGHVVENARLVDVDGAARGDCEQAVSFVVVHGRSFSHQIHHSTIGCFHTRTLVVVRSAVGETGGRRGSIHAHPKLSVLMKLTVRRVELGTNSHKTSIQTFFHRHILQEHLRPCSRYMQTNPT